MQSNSLPNHCFYSSETNPVEIETDWKVKFNSNVVGEGLNKSFDTSLGINGCGSTPNTFSTKERHILAIIIDGLRPDALMQANTPAFDSLIDNGLLSIETRTHLEESTMSGPGWTSLLKGVEPSKHGDYGNSDSDWLSHGCDYKTFLWYAKDAGLTTCSVSTDQKIFAH